MFIDIGYNNHQINKLGLNRYNLKFIGYDKSFSGISRIALGWHFNNLFSAATELTSVKEVYTENSGIGIRHYRNVSLLGRYNYANSFLSSGWMQPYFQLGLGLGGFGSSSKKGIAPSVNVGTGLHFWIFSIFGAHLQFSYKPLDFYKTHYSFGLSFGFGGNIRPEKDSLEQKQLISQEDLQVERIEKLGKKIKQELSLDASAPKRKLTQEEVKKTSLQIINLAKIINFQLGSVVLTPESLIVMEKIVKLVNNTDLEILVEGHTDNIGSANSNKKLSVKRAKVVRDYLRYSGLDNKLTFIGYGEERPIQDNDTPEGRRANRRVEIKISNPKQNPTSKTNGTTSKDVVSPNTKNLLKN